MRNNIFSLFWFRTFHIIFCVHTLSNANDSEKSHTLESVAACWELVIHQPLVSSSSPPPSASSLPSSSVVVDNTIATRYHKKAVQPKCAMRVLARHGESYDKTDRRAYSWKFLGLVCMQKDEEKTHRVSRFTQDLLLLNQRVRACLVGGWTRLYTHTHMAKSSEYLCVRACIPFVCVLS